ncbi:aluminum-activated malate transporter 10 [Nicotiana tomentosiformis]|uniref:aluminum-activated malate transporter 10 n=1 Tax=Nicotiana tomentosiformis TaxID=4098 RepID=UPI00051B8D7F
MVKENEVSAASLEWRVNMPSGSSQILVPESRQTCRLLSLVMGFVSNITKFLDKAWNLAVNEPKKVIHCLKVGLALSIVSLFYYMRPLYDGVGGNAMWAVMTVVVVFEYTVGSTLYKCVNRAIGTCLAGSLGIGVHWVASQSGDRFEPIILQASVFLLAAAATFSRFIPTIKARFDYGAMIFILTFSLVSVSGYRVDKLVELAHERVSTIAIGATICLFITMILCPVWAGTELHHLISTNLQKLADSLEGYAAEKFRVDGSKNLDEKDSSKRLQGYRCVLNSKAAEESMANFARWEPAHGKFNFRHPWKQYLKIGASMRSCAYCIETLHGGINSNTETPEFLKKPLNDVCMRLGTSSSNVLKELSSMIKTLTNSTKLDILVDEMNSSVEGLQNALKTLPSYQHIPTPDPKTEEAPTGTEESILKPTALSLMEIVQMATLTSLLIEIASRIEGIVKEVNELASQAQFKDDSSKKSKQTQTKLNENDGNEHEVTMTTLQKV